MNEFYMSELVSNYIIGFRESQGRAKMAPPMDLSKAFDTINHDLLLAKLKAYDFFKYALTLICSYLENRKQRVVNNNRASTTQKKL